ncbi:unnamed protein product, partial [Ectocarpus fasciculatus]
ATVFRATYSIIVISPLLVCLFVCGHTEALRVGAFHEHSYSWCCWHSYSYSWCCWHSSLLLCEIVLFHPLTRARGLALWLLGLATKSKIGLTALFLHKDHVVWVSILPPKERFDWLVFFFLALGRLYNGCCGR